MSNFIYPLKKADFRYLFASQITNNLAQFLDYIAIVALIVFEWHKGAINIAIFSVIFSMPMIFLSPIIGYFSDRLPVKTVLIVTTFISSILTLGFIFTNTLILLFALLLIRSCIKLFYYPLETKLIRELFSDKEVAKANSLTQLVSQFSKIFGPALCSFLLIFFSPKSIFFITALLYLISAATLCFLTSSLDSLNSSNRVKLTIFENILSCFKIYLNNKVLYLSVIALFAILFSLFLSESMISLLAKHMGLSSSSFGLILSMLGIGGVLGSILIGAFLDKLHPFAMLNLSLIFAGIFISSSAIVSEFIGSLSTILFLIMWLLVGVSISGTQISFQTILQTNIPKGLLGQASTVINIVIGISLFTAPLLGSFIMHLYGVVNLFLLTGIGIIFSALIISALSKF